MIVRPLRLMLYDQTCAGAPGLPGLSHAWWTGGHLYRGLGRIDRFAGFADWPAALRWLAEVEPDRPIGEVQLWCHGKWGHARLDRTPLDAGALSPSHRWHGLLCAIRDRLAGPDALFWFRTCETFGARAGHDFARRWTDFTGCRAAGHTYIIATWQSGLHSLRPGDSPTWSLREGLREGTPDAPVRAHWSGPRAPNTITCFHGTVPAAF